MILWYFTSVRAKHEHYIHSLILMKNDNIYNSYGKTQHFIMAITLLIYANHNIITTCMNLGIKQITIAFDDNYVWMKI